MSDRWTSNPERGVARSRITGDTAAVTTAGESVPDAGRTAAQILAQANLAAARRAAAGGPTGRPVHATTAGLLRRAAGLAGAVAVSVHALAGRVSAAAGRKTVLAAVLVVSVGLLLRSLPTFDPPLAETHRELSAVWEEARSHRESTAPSAWEEFAQRALPRLETVACDLERSYERRLGTGLWAFAFGRSRPTEAARLDLLRVAKYDLPAVLRAGPRGRDVREPFVEQRLTRVGEHLAGVSPYLPPLRPATPLPEQEIASAAPASPAWESYALAAFLGFDVVIAGGWVFFFWRRTRALA